MKKAYIFIVAASILGWPWIFSAPAKDISYYLGDHQYNQVIPKPESVLGFRVGEWHVRHDQLVAYMRALADASDRIQLETIGYSHERRPLIHLIISAPTNLAKIEQIQQDHHALAMGENTPPLEDMPLVVCLGYSVHGNESSGSNAALLVAYHLAAATDIDPLLERTVIILDPCLNPDGLSRFAQWANMHRGNRLVADADHREHREGWPSGRTNHYWFDLNRDWLLLQHPESRARVARFHHWRPNILTDFHEMGTNSTYFFQPGIPTRQNPLTPQESFELTHLVARYHARSFNSVGQLYFSEQIFDDFYYGKGSTYPDIQGGIGILFEQASSRGHLQESSLGDLSFPQTVKNQVTTSLSTLQAGIENRVQFLEYQRDFFKNTLAEARKDPVKANVFGDGGDPARAFEMIDVLQRHQIEVYRLAKPLTQGETTIETGYVVPTGQNQYRLVKSLFETVTEFQDQTFYDISTWHFPSAFGLPHAVLKAKALGKDLLGARLEPVSFPSNDFVPKADAYGFLFEWSHYYAPRAVQRLLEKDIRLRFATKSFALETNRGKHAFSHGTVLLAMGIQTAPEKVILETLAEIAERDGIVVYTVETGLTPEGIDLGSPSFAELKPPKPLLLVGGRVSTYEAGEVWHLLDHRFAMPLPLVEINRFSRIDLSRYTHLLMVNGNYNQLGEDTAANIKQWVRNGGVLVATKSAGKWVEKHELIKVKFSEEEKSKGDEKEPTERLPYGDRSQIAAWQGINGAIFQGLVDPTHPVGYGFGERLALFRNHTLFLETSEDPYATVIQYSQQPLISGYVSSKNQERLKGSAALIAEGLGRGAVILILDNPNFRGFWYGTNKLMLNSLFFSSAIQPTRNLPR